MFKYRRARVALLTLALGLAVARLSEYYEEKNAFTSVTQEQIDNAVFIMESPKYLFRGHACFRPGFESNYETPGGGWVSAGSIPITKAEFTTELESSTLIEKVDNYRDLEGKKGTRVIIRQTGKSGKEYFEILWFRDEWLAYISASTLEIAQDLEKIRAASYK